MTPAEVAPPGAAYTGIHKVRATATAKNKAFSVDVPAGKKAWAHLCKSHAGVMRRCYIDLADNPFPKLPTPRHHRLKGKRLRDFWEWEVGGGERVRYKAGADGSPVVVYAGPAPSSTH